MKGNEVREGTQDQSNQATRGNLDNSGKGREGRECEANQNHMQTLLSSPSLHATLPAGDKSVGNGISSCNPQHSPGGTTTGISCSVLKRSVL